MNKRIRIAIAVLLIAAAAGTALYLYLDKYTNVIEKLTAVEIKEGQADSISFHYKGEDVLRIKSRCFVPEESGEYLFTVSDIDAGNAAVGLYVANEDFTEYMIAENYIPGEDDEKEISASTYLQKGAKCYISTVLISMEDETATPFDGSFSLMVSKKPEYTEPPLLTPEEDALLVIKPEDRACARFIPEETGYYRFDTSIVSDDASTGFSSISSIISPDNLKTQITEGISYLETGKEYYIWVTVHETTGGESDVSLSVKPMNLLKISGACEITLTEDTMLEYHAEGSDYMAVYSASDGNPNALIYEKAGFAVRTDEDGEDSLSDNEKDFAMVFSQKDGSNYCIGVYGDLGTGCKVTIVPYTGDGSSLTLDDVDLTVLEAQEDGKEPENGSEAVGNEGAAAEDQDAQAEAEADTEEDGQ